MRIKNINGISDNTCSCRSWLKHWKKFSNQTVTYCPVLGCLNIDLIGAHVQKATGDENKWYIYPLCNEHNKSTDVLEVSGSYSLVSANRSETCGKEIKSISPIHNIAE